MNHKASHKPPFWQRKKKKKMLYRRQRAHHLAIPCIQLPLPTQTSLFKVILINGQVNVLASSISPHNFLTFDIKSTKKKKYIFFRRDSNSRSTSGTTVLKSSPIWMTSWKIPEIFYMLREIFFSEHTTSSLKETPTKQKNASRSAPQWSNTPWEQYLGVSLFPISEWIYPAIATLLFLPYLEIIHRGKAPYTVAVG